MSTENETTAAIMKEEAEARRQRIMEHANDRLGVVEGKISAAAEEEKKSSSAARLAAMRRRRFKTKSKQGEGDGEPTDEKKADAPSAPSVESETPKVEDAKEEAVSNVVGEETPTEAMKDTMDTVSATGRPPDDTTGPDDDTAEPKKKYVGVAKMRRRMIKEKQNQKETVGADVVDNDDKKTHAVKQLLLQKQQQGKFFPKLPILMYAFTAVLLFLAGLDVGLQQDTENYNVLTVHSELAPRKLGGVAKIMEYTMGTTRSSGVSQTTTKPKGVLEESSSLLVDEEHDEFSDVPKVADSEDISVNLDPLFKVDLDKLTQGSGLYFTLARFAVAVHRFHLAIFYYGPQRLFRAIVSMFITAPPIFCLLAIVIRQLIGKTILGAKLPDKIEDETQHKDVMSMIKNFISNFILRAFPTAVTLYDVFTHLRADMYVVLCGFFVGIAFSHNHMAGHMFGLDEVPIVVDETAPAVEIPAEGISDEL